ncbi:hypothetical protein [Mycolicibacterium iranicum]|uniref:Integrase n=1 Tax=Mycolicibacterium iranicum TaxID=912594 RepID=A0ABT4HGD8_MYCIR|nr:hypothetical protein [Mycolicibacterium iranicum]MCZ0728762.1 hypothetical protein [Mycolicibacterium iranicum]
MNIDLAAAMAVPTVALAALTMGASSAPASAQPYGPDTCISGYVWREARGGDNVCVTPNIRDAVAQQNANPGAHKDPNAGSGPQGCASGFVWREAFDGDTICVTPAFRQQMWDANAAAFSRKAVNQAPVPAQQPDPDPGGPPPQPGYGAPAGGETPWEDIDNKDACSPDAMAPPAKYNTDLCMLPYEG